MKTGNSGKLIDRVAVPFSRGVEVMSIPQRSVISGVLDVVHEFVGMVSRKRNWDFLPR